MTKKFGKKFWLYVSIAVLFLVLGAVWVFHGKGGAAAPAGMMMQGEQAAPDVVNAETPETGSIFLIV